MDADQRREKQEQELNRQGAKKTNGGTADKRNMRG